jgi:hypothetical protein
MKNSDIIVVVHVGNSEKIKYNSKSEVTVLRPGYWHFINTKTQYTIS